MEIEINGRLKALLDERKLLLDGGVAECEADAGLWVMRFGELDRDIALLFSHQYFLNIARGG